MEDHAKLSSFEETYKQLSKTAERPRFDQLPFDLVSNKTGGALTLSHFTTEHTYTSTNTDDDWGVRTKKLMEEGSVYSYISTRDNSRFVKDVHGRIFNALNDAYLLPSDESEWSRLDRQHIAIGIGLGGLTPCPEVVEALLAPEPGKEKKILDLGCGTGVWAAEIAKLFPHCSVTGVDVAPNPIDQTLLPPNLHFEIDDINEGLEHYHNSFDLIQMRLVMVGIRDFERAMEDVQLCLKPGGLVIIIDGDINLYAEDRLHADTIKEGPNSEGSWFRKIVYEAHEANKIAGARMDQAGELIDMGFWDHPGCDPDTATGGSLYLPIGPWPKVPDPAQSQLLGYAGILMRLVFLNIHRAYHAILIRHGMYQATLDEWSKKVDEELGIAKPGDTTLGDVKRKMWVRFRICWARRRAGPDLPAPPLPTLPLLASQSTTMSTSASTGVVEAQQAPRAHYPYFEVYKSGEEAAKAIQARKDALGIIPESELRMAWARKQAREEVTKLDALLDGE